ncbi:MAG TPA: DMT family transporter [Methylomirabilota bacterium]|nr:DMT family transporter [Methylomirabilota bacterium]
MSSRLALAVAAGVVATLLYGGQFVISRWSIQRTLSMWDLAALRFATAGLLLLPVVLRHGVAGAAGIGWGRAVALAIAAGAPYTLILYGGLALAPAADGAVIITGATPVISAGLVWLWFGERPWPARLAGLGLIVAGLVMVGWPGLSGGAGAWTWLGDLLFAADAVLWGLYTVLARRWRVDPLRATAMVWTLALAYLPIYFAFAGSRLLAAPRGEVLFQALYQGVGVAIVALALYSWAIRVLGASVASLFMPLVPVFGTLLAIPVLGELPAGVQLVGIVVVSAGMAAAAAGSRRRR